VDYLTLKNGLKTLVRAIATSSGVADADKLVRTSADGKIDSSLLPATAGGSDFPSTITTATGNITLTTTSNRVQYLDPGGSNRTVTFPTGAGALDLMFVVKHIGTSKRLTLDGNVKLRPNQVAWMHYDGTIWRQIN